MMNKRIVAATLLTLLAPISQADGLRFTYVDAGLFGGDSNDYDGDEARFRVRGSIAVGDTLYFPLAMESTAFETEDGEYSQNDLSFAAGIGMRFINIEDRFSFTGDLSLVAQTTSIDYDGGFDDEDEDDDGIGHLARLGVRGQPSDLIELQAELSQREVEMDFWDEQVRRRLLALQFNISPLFAVGAEWHRDRYRYDDEFFGVDIVTTRYVGGYVRFSFK